MEAEVRLREEKEAWAGELVRELEREKKVHCFWFGSWILWD